MSRQNYKKKRGGFLIVLLVWFILMLIPIGFYGRRVYDIYSARQTNQANQSIDTSNFYHPDIPSANSAPSPSAGISTLPTNALIDIAFTAQAPNAVWDALHEDACEEASFIMVKHYLDKTSLGSPSDVDQEIQAMVAYETQNGYGPSITSEDLAKVVQNHYGMTGQVKSATIENIESDIASGHPVIIPAAGKLLDNPNFKDGGPNYHMLVIKGYDGTNFITNDPGTRNGNGYVYTQTTLMNAIHDWDSANILNGPAVYLVF